MREILFRGKRVDNGEMVYGMPLESKFNCTYMLTKQGGLSADFIYSKYTIIDSKDSIAVKTESIGQFTGLLDKNGNKIFEGDICRFKWNPILNEPSDLFTFELPVVYYKTWGCWCFHLKTNKMNIPQRELFTDYSIEEKYVAIGNPIEYAENPSDGVEIIGNIHE